MENSEGSGSSRLGKRFRCIIPVSCIQLYTKQTIMFIKNRKFRSSSWWWWFQPIWIKMLFKLDHFSKDPGGKKEKKCLKPPNQSSFSKQKKPVWIIHLKNLGFSKWHRHISQANLLPYSCNSNPSKGQVKTGCTDELQEKTIRTLDSFKLPGSRSGVSCCCCCFNFFRWPKPMRCPNMFFVNPPPPRFFIP